MSIGPQNSLCSGHARQALTTPLMVADVVTGWSSIREVVGGVLPLAPRAPSSARPASVRLGPPVAGRGPASGWSGWARASVGETKLGESGLEAEPGGSHDVRLPA
jgi:hypothetical protein